LAANGVEVAAIALNENDAAVYKTEPESQDGASIKILRCSATMPWIERIRLARMFADDFRPDWMSLHFVCYGFHPRGLVAGLAKHLKPLLHGYRVEIMLHELWVMWQMDCRLRDRLTGILQRILVLKLLRAVEPDVLHTHVTAYQAELISAGMRPKYLPLAGAISVQDRDARNWLGAWFEKRGFFGVFESREHFWLFGLFGTIYSGWDAGALIQRIIDVAARVGRRPIFLSFGGAGARGLQLWHALGAAFPQEAILRLEEKLDEEKVSQCLNSMDFGLTSYSPDFFEKSSAGISMIEHGLPVIISKGRELCIDTGDFPEPLNQDRWIIVDADFEQRLSTAVRRQPKSRLDLVAGKFLADLGSCSPD